MLPRPRARHTLTKKSAATLVWHWTQQPLWRQDKRSCVIG